MIGLKEMSVRIIFFRDKQINGETPTMVVAIGKPQSLPQIGELAISIAMCRRIQLKSFEKATHGGSIITARLEVPATLDPGILQPPGRQNPHPHGEMIETPLNLPGISQNQIANGKKTTGKQAHQGKTLESTTHGNTYRISFTALSECAGSHYQSTGKTPEEH
ncbi:MAG: hypothetical protein AB7W16_14980 [Candidatus Obscuribacterales bacterium]